MVRYTLDEFGTARRCAVVRGFIDALTRGGLGGTPRPIEMHSHDPMRYGSGPIYGLLENAGLHLPHLCTDYDLMLHVNVKIESALKISQQPELIKETVHPIANVAANSRRMPLMFPSRPVTSTSRCILPFHSAV